MPFKPKLLTTLLTSLLLQQTAYATDAIYSNADTGWAQLDSIPTAQQANANSKTQKTYFTTWHTDIGYNHDFNTWFGFGFEVDAAKYGKLTYQQNNGKTNITVHDLAFMFPALFHLSKIDIGVKAGISITVMTHTGLLTNRKETKSPEYQLALGYPLSAHTAIQATYVHLTKSKKNNNSLPLIGPSLNSILIGVKITF